MFNTHVVNNPPPICAPQYTHITRYNTQPTKSRPTSVNQPQLMDNPHNSPMWCYIIATHHIHHRIMHFPALHVAMLLQCASIMCMRPTNRQSTLTTLQSSNNVCDQPMFNHYMYTWRHQPPCININVPMFPSYALTTWPHGSTCPSRYGWLPCPITGTINSWHTMCITTPKCAAIIHNSHHNTHT